MSGRIVPLSLVTVSAALAANAGAAFTLSANPIGPQPISVVFAAGWDGGSVTITGTAVDPKNVYNEDGTLRVSAWSEVVAPPLVLPGIVETTRAFATVTSASKALVGATTNTAQLKALFPTQAPIQLSGNVAGADSIHANILITKAWVVTGTVDLVPLLWENDRWWPQPGGTLTVVQGTDLNDSKIGRYVTIGDPSTYYHLWMTNTGTLGNAYLNGKTGPSSSL